jgi:integrase
MCPENGALEGEHMPYMKDTSIRPNQYKSSMKAKLKKMTGELRTNNVANELERKIQRVKKTRTLSENVEKVLEFDRECEQNGHKTGTRYSALITLHYLCQFAGKKPFKQLTKADIINFLDAAKNRKFEDTRYRARVRNVEKELANSTMNLVKLRVKRFNQWLYGMKKGQYPESVDWIELKAIKGDREINPEDLPTVDEIKEMIECTDNPRDRALISLIAESGIRCGEASTTLLRDISWNSNGFVLTVRHDRTKSKFGRRIPLCACAEDVKNYINNFHPFKGDEESPLFVSFADRKTPKSNLKVASIETIVRKVSERAGVSKRIRVHPHIFRHARASQLAELGWNEPMLRQYFGWSKTSSMPATYIHMS